MSFWGQSNTHSAIVKAVIESLSDDLAATEHNAEITDLIVTALVELGYVIPAERWADDCHVCDAAIGAHAIDGHCPGDSATMATSESGLVGAAR